MENRIRYCKICNKAFDPYDVQIKRAVGRRPVYCGSSECKIKGKKFSDAKSQRIRHFKKEGPAKQLEIYTTLLQDNYESAPFSKFLVSDNQAVPIKDIKTKDEIKNIWSQKEIKNMFK